MCTFLKLPEAQEYVESWPFVLFFGWLGAIIFSTFGVQVGTIGFRNYSLVPRELLRNGGLSGT